MTLTNQQFQQVTNQVRAYEKIAEVQRMPITLNNEKYEIEIDPLVANPSIMNSGLQVLKYLESHPSLIKDQIITDMGTGCGIIGLACALLGAKKVYMADIDQKAISNTQRNIQRLGIINICETFQSDLFSNFSEHQKADIQIFNHPFFADAPIQGKDWTRMMLGGTSLIENYLRNAPNFSNPDAQYIMPWLTTANNTAEIDNDPGKRAPTQGYKIIKCASQNPVESGIQQDPFAIYVLQHP